MDATAVWKQMAHLFLHDATPAEGISLLATRIHEREREAAVLAAKLRKTEDQVRSLLSSMGVIRQLAGQHTGQG